ncbi:nitroreductase family protein [Amycolatopsis carbonis]|uniref:Nitroreductase family protein n=1 Tax=Amycolatopsis carbonis TaxID=715471 RepID=A0A9Y2MZP3_9PSEU|nr:nitroreductase family protein [Amycolatopsis sp. 2-15]WIX82823.1 nitroreductase family protein [Amycolatopsis sp. 2-15]
MTTLDLTPDELLSTTRAVRKRLDFTRPVPDELIRECVTLALQAPTGSNVVTARFVVVTDQEKRAALGEIYRDGYDKFMRSPGYPRRWKFEDAETKAQYDKMSSSAEYLGDHMGDAPALVLGCSTGPDRYSAVAGASNVLPSIWSFMLAARARGLGTAWTTLHALREQEIAQLLGIPYDNVAQLVMIPLAYTLGTDFKPAPRPDAEEVIHWNQW